ncbi:MAG: Cohesin domain [Candidatus Eisenbacteria bacterium]|jgi:hypothetical protein
MLRDLRLSLLCVLATLLLVAPGESRATNVSLVPTDSVLTVADEVELRLLADDVLDLKGFQVIISFDPAVLQALSAAQGSLLPANPAECFFYFAIDGDAGSGTVQIDAALLSGSAHGDGTLATVRFRAVALGHSPVVVSLVDFRDSANGMSTPATTGATIRILGPVPTKRTSWGRLKKLYG